MPGVFTQQPFTGVVTRTNYCQHPNAELSTTSGWAVLGASTISASTAAKHSGSYSYRCQTTAVAQGLTQGLTDLVAMPAGSGMYSAWVIIASGGSAVEVRVREWTPASVLVGTSAVVTVPANGAWQRVSIPYVKTDPANLTRMEFVTASATATTFFVDDVMFETGSVLNPYYDGSTPNLDVVNYRWAGVAHASVTNYVIPLPAEQITPLFGPLAPTEYASESSMIVHELMDDPSVTWLTYRPAKRRKGEWRLLFDTEDAAVDAVNRFPGWGTFSFDGDGRATLAVSRFVVPAGQSVTMRPVQELMPNSTGDQWLYEVVVPWQEVSP